jgi:tyrosine phenol-lyase
MARLDDEDPALGQMAQTLAEPFRIKSVESIRLPRRSERERILREAFYSVMYLDSADVFVDLGTDSGTGAMSDTQWAAMMRGDEAYVRSRSYGVFERAVREVTGYTHVIPTHQGRGAENILMELLVKPGDIVLGNAHFDTTRAHITRRQGIPVDLVGDQLWSFSEEHPFKGNVDLDKLAAALARYADRVPFIVLTITNNLACSSPVSLENIRGVRALADRYGKPVYFDACRMSENAYFVKSREAGCGQLSVAEIVREALSYGEGCWMSAKKDALVNVGGFLALKDEKLARRCQELLVLYEGFPSYGGLARRDLEAVAVGLREGLDEAYLAHRTGLVAHFAARLEREAGVRVSRPAGGSGVFVDVGSVYPHLDESRHPGVAFACDAYLEGAVRLGAIPFHLRTVRCPDGEIVDRTFQFARLAVPRRVYTKSHLDYVVGVLGLVKKRARENRGYRVVEYPEVLGHFFAKFEPIGGGSTVAG